MSLTVKDQYLSLFFADLESGEFPLRVSAEATMHCNLQCPYCPREGSGRGVDHMKDDLFEQISDQLVGKLTVLAPQGFGEPFINPKLGERLRSAKAKGVQYIDLVTNGTLLTEENCRHVIEAEVTLITIELDGADKAVFEANRKNANYDEVVENVERLFRMRDEMNSPHPHICLQVIQMPEIVPSMPAFHAHWTPFLREGDEIFEGQAVTWAGDRPMPNKVAATEEELKTRPPCRFLYKQLQIYFDGRATPCIYDHKCQMEIGNAKEQSIEEIWHGEPLRKLRELHEQGRSGEIPICRGCPDHLE